jgi:outer membrane protein assembly factor BamB
MKSSNDLIFLLCALPIVLAPLADAAETGWPQWRGPNADGTSLDATPPVEWSATKNVRWKTAIPGRGSASPVVLGDKVFVVSAIGDGPKVRDAQPAPRRERGGQGAGDRRRRGGAPRGGEDAGAPLTKQQFVVFCLDRKSGAVRWQKAVNELVPHAGHHDDHGFASASPITDGEHVWAHFGSRGTFCLNAADGELVWARTDLGKMETRGGFGDGSSPVLQDDRLIVPWDHEGDSSILALDKKTGKTLWKTARDHPSSWTTPLVVEHGGSKQVIQSGEGSAVSYDFASGKELWRADGQTARPVATPVAAGGVAYIGSGFRGSFLGAYRLDGANGDITESDKVVWTVTSGTPDIASFLLSDGRLYFHSGKDGILSCLDAKTGKAHYSRERIPGLSRVYASPIAANGHVYLTGREGVTVVIKDGAKLEVVASNELGEPIDATPAPVGDALFIRGSKHLYCIGE